MRISDARCHAAQGESGICVILKWRLWGILLSVGEKELLKIRKYLRSQARCERKTATFDSFTAEHELYFLSSDRACLIFGISLPLKRKRRSNHSLGSIHRRRQMKD